jgi:uncharacterized OB-fold protein
MTDQPHFAGALTSDYAELHADAWTAPFWAGARRHELLAPQCTSCGTFRMPPGPFCHVCRQQDVDWVRLPGTGTIFTFTHVRHPVVPSLRELVPYTVAVVDLDGAPGARLVGNVVDSPESTVVIGAAIRVVFDDFDDIDVTIPRFVVAS